jgi:hypothetical protein
MSPSSEGRSKGLPLNVVMSPAMAVVSFFLVGTWYRRWAGVVAKLLVGWTGQGGVLKTGLQVRSEEEEQLARSNRDSWRIHVTVSCRLQEENAKNDWMQYTQIDAASTAWRWAASSDCDQTRQELPEEGIAGLHQKVSRRIECAAAGSPNSSHTTQRARTCLNTVAT